MLENKFLFFLINVIIIAIPVALLEILIEKDKGWGAGHPKDKWYGKIIGLNNPIMKTICGSLGIPYIFGYGLLMYFILIPAVLVIEYFTLVPNVPLLIAIYVAATALEDFSWFVLNWHFDSLHQLLKGPNGTIWWHKRWIKIFPKTYLPASYLTALILVIFFYWISNIKAPYGAFCFLPPWSYSSEYGQAILAPRLGPDSESGLSLYVANKTIGAGL